MCRGLAMGFNWKDGVICTGKSSHTETLKNSEDTTLKLELIIDDSQECNYKLELDEQYIYNGKLDSVVKKQFLNMITNTGKIRKEVRDLINKWIKENEIQVLRWLLVNRSYAISSGNTNNSSQKTGGNTYNSYQKTGGNTDNSFQETGGNTNNSYQKTGGNTYNSFQETGGNTYNDCQKTGGNTYNSFQETGGNTYNGCQKTGKNCYITYSKVGLNNSSKEDVNKFIDKLSGINNCLTLTQLTRIAMECPESKIYEIMTNE